MVRIAHKKIAQKIWENPAKEENPEVAEVD
jgi:hypothetical protein